MILIMTLTSMFSVSILICGETLTRINLAASDSEQSVAALGHSGVAGGPGGGDRQWIDGIDQLQELAAGQRRREYIALRRERTPISRKWISYSKVSAPSATTFMRILCASSIRVSTMVAELRSVPMASTNILSIR
jgi:hypothetical protein